MTQSHNLKRSIRCDKLLALCAFLRNVHVTYQIQSNTNSSSVISSFNAIIFNETVLFITCHSSTSICLAFNCVQSSVTICKLLLDTNGVALNAMPENEDQDEEDQVADAAYPPSCTNCHFFALRVKRKASVLFTVIDPPRLRCRKRVMRNICWNLCFVIIYPSTVNLFLGSVIPSPCLNGPAIMPDAFLLVAHQRARCSTDANPFAVRRTTVNSPYTTILRVLPSVFFSLNSSDFYQLLIKSQVQGIFSACTLASPPYLTSLMCSDIQIHW